MHGRHAILLTQQKIKWIISTCKIMCTVSCIRKSVILMDFTQRNKTTNTTAYGAILKKLRPTFPSKTQSLLIDGVLLLQCWQCQITCCLYNSRSHRVLQLAEPFIVLNILNARFTLVSLSPYKLLCYDAFFSHWVCSTATIPGVTSLECKTTSVLCSISKNDRTQLIKKLLH